MPAKVILITGPVSSGKTHALLTRYRNRVAADIGTSIWLTPSERAADALRPRLMAAGGAVISPNVMTFPDFARQVVRAAEPAARMLPELHQRLLLDDVLADLARRGDLPFFAAVAGSRGIADAVFGFLTELKGQGIGPATFAATVRELAGAEGRRLAEKAGQVARIFANYQKRLDDGRLLDRDATYARAREIWPAGRLGPFAAVRNVFVDGFIDFTPPQLNLLAAVADTANEVWITLLSDRFGDESRSELFARISDTTANLNLSLTIDPSPESPLTFRPARPGGLAHLERAIFRPESLPLSTDADGLLIVEAPGLLGETRLVARAVKTLLLDGTLADEIIVTARDLGPYADLVREVFGEYGIPLDLEGTDPLIRNPAIGVLLRAARLAEDGFPFAATTALVRCTYFHPAWPEVEADPDVAAHCDVLLRMLGEPREAKPYLDAARMWAAELPPGLEDEEAEESRRRRKHELAKRCLPFLERFFQAWDGMPEKAGLTAFADWLRTFAADLGLAREAEQTDSLAWARFWDEVDDWAVRQAQMHSRPPVHSRSEALHLIATLAASSGLPRSSRGPGRVRVLPAEQARHLDCDHLFLMGMGERSFPDMGGSGPLFDESERQAFRGAGLDVRSAADRLPDEMLLFYQLVTRPRRRLILSFPAVDDKGQDLLSSTFLTNVIECFDEGVVPVKKQRMLIEGFDRVRPLSPAEYRVRWAAGDNEPVPATATMSADLFDHVRAAGSIYRARFGREFTPYDGMLRAPAVLGDVRDRFGPDKIFSPTALENYVACPFRFYLDQVLKLEPLEDPSEEVEAVRRGAAVHRALSRFHQRLNTEDVKIPADDLNERLVGELRRAVEEYASRVSSPTAKMLWRLEGRRLERAAERYAPHWDKFRKLWADLIGPPRPHSFEVDFGLGGTAPAAGPLVIRHQTIEVRIGGRIDRIDIAELEDGTVGFWVIDYKTGRSGYYSGTALAAMEKLQLTLYALAVERLLVPGARPLGLAYWMVTEAGHKRGLPSRTTEWLTDADAWPRFRERLEEWVATLVDNIRGGIFPLKPRDENCTNTCPYGQVCRIAQARSVEKTWELPLPTDAMTNEANEDG
jgi:ATP-dependent helicase/nuclease subunit B